MISKEDFELAENYFDLLPTREDQRVYLDILREYSKRGGVSESSENISLLQIDDSKSKQMRFGVFMDFPPDPEILGRMMTELEKSDGLSTWRGLVEN